MKYKRGNSSYDESTGSVKDSKFMQEYSCEVKIFIGINGTRGILQTLHIRRYFTAYSGILGKVFN